MANAAAREERSVVTSVQQVTDLSALGGTSRRLLANVSLALLLFGGLAVGPACARDEPAVKKKAADDDGDSPKKSKRKKAADEDGEDDSRTKKSDDDQVSSKKKRKSADEESPKAAPPAFEVNERVVRAAFLALGPDIDRGLGFQSYNIVIGDLNGDDKADAVVDYSLATEKGNTGNMGSAYSGLVVFVNTGKKLVVADHSEKFSSFGSTAKRVSSIKSGVIVLDGPEYAPEDGHCCPSLRTKLRLVLRDGKLNKLE